MAKMLKLQYKANRPKLGQFGLLAFLLSMNWTAVSFAGTAGHPVNLYQPSGGTQDYSAVHAARNLDEKAFAFSLFADYAQGGLPSDGSQNTPDRLIHSHIWLGYGLHKRFELGLSLPFVAFQSVSDASTRGQFEEPGHIETRAYAKLILVDGDSFQLSWLQSFYANRLEFDPFMGEGSSFGSSAEIIPEFYLDRWSIALNAGYRWQQAGERLADALFDPVGSRWVYGAATRYAFKNSRSSLSLEGYGSYIQDAQWQSELDVSAHAAEVLGAYHFQLSPFSKAQFAVARRVTEGLGDADLRVVVGIHHQFGGKGQKVAEKKKKPKKRKIARKKRRPEPAAMPEPEPELPAMPMEEPQLLAAADMPTEVPDEVIVLNDINFAFDSDNSIVPGGLLQLEKLAQHLEGREFDMMIIEGHCDYLGSDEYNFDLSTRRSRNVARHLVRAHGFDGSKMQYIGFGKRQPKTEDNSDLGRQINRRVEIKIYRGEKIKLSSK